MPLFTLQPTMRHATEKGKAGQARTGSPALHPNGWESKQTKRGQRTKKILSYALHAEKECLVPKPECCYHPAART